MKLNRATRYALYALLELTGDPEKHLSATEIAQKYGTAIQRKVKAVVASGQIFVMQDFFKFDPIICPSE